MSRIILTKHDNGEPHIVVGWDRPQATFYWQEFNKEPEVFQQENGRWGIKNYHGVKKQTYATQAEAEEHQWEDWEEMAGYAGYSPRELPSTLDLTNSASSNDRVMKAILLAASKDLLPELERHRKLEFPESNKIVDLSQ